MSNPVPLPPPGFDDITVEEKVEHLDAPWDRLAAHQDEASMPERQRALVGERLADHRADPGVARDPDEALASIDEKLRTRRG